MNKTLWTRPLVAAAAAVCAAGGLMAAPLTAEAAEAQAQPSFTCKSGFVWRESSPGDLVCVLPEVRARTGLENALAADRWVAGSFRCKSGFVWREALPFDRVCVTPNSRTEAAIDNSQALERLAAQ
jgi:hypothetical protein